RCNGGYLTPQERLIACETEPPLLLERRHRSDGVFEFLLRDHHPILLGQAQEDGAFCQFFQSHLAEIKLGVEVDLLHTKDSAILLLQRILDILEFTDTDRLAKNSRDLRAGWATTRTHAPLMKNGDNKGQDDGQEHSINNPGLGVSHPLQ